jgi:hypothetical protein
MSATLENGQIGKLQLNAAWNVAEVSKFVYVTVSAFAIQVSSWTTALVNLMEQSHVILIVAQHGLKTAQVAQAALAAQVAQVAQAAALAAVPAAAIAVKVGLIKN